MHMEYEKNFTMSTTSTEKSPVDREDYEGLQLDTRAKDSTEKHLDPLSPPQVLRDNDDYEYRSEKQATEDTPQTSPNSSYSTARLDAGVPAPILPDESAGSPPAPKARRICGLHRQIFWIIFGLIGAIVVAAAVIGAAIGRTRHSSSSDPANVPSINSTDNILDHSNVMIGSPLNVISYSEPTTGDETFRMYFQSESGNIKEIFRTGMGPWMNANPIFTDAMNKSGLATITYLNTSQQQGSIFYISNDNPDGSALLREKRRNFVTDDHWDYGSLSHQNYHYAVPGNMNFSLESKAANSWDSFRMAAVYSQNFTTGAGCRLFYHAGNAIQELIWYQSNDTWRNGSLIPDALPNSHLSATIDDSNQILRLFYWNKNKELEYSYTNITAGGQDYQKGGGPFSNLTTAFSDIAALSDNGITYVYYYSNSASHICEIEISRPPSLQEKFNTSFISLPENNTSLYQPLTAVKTTAKWYVFWADHSTPGGGMNFSSAKSSNQSGYSMITGLSRTVNNRTWSDKADLPLGDKTVDPHSQSARVGRRFVVQSFDMASMRSNLCADACTFFYFASINGGRGTVQMIPSPGKGNS